MKKSLWVGWVLRERGRNLRSRSKGEESISVENGVRNRERGLKDRWQREVLVSG